MKICWFGIYNPDFGRNKIYIRALKKAGHTVIECREDSQGFSKYWSLWKRLRAIKDDYDVLVVGYPGHIVVPLAKFLSKRKIVADALGSLYDAEVYSHTPTFFRKLKSRFADWLMVRYADRILLESEAQKRFFIEKFGKSEKYAVVYTGADEKFIKGANERSGQEALQSITKEEKTGFTVLFRGKLTPESGIMYILKAAEILKENKDIEFRIIGSGYFLEKAQLFIHKYGLLNVELISRYLSDKELVSEMRMSGLMLGQFEDNARLLRTIPHKAFEAFAMGKAYLTGNVSGIKEITEDAMSAFFVPLADPAAIADKIEYLSEQPELLSKVALGGKRVFNEKCAPGVLVEKLVKVMV